MADTIPVSVKCGNCGGRLTWPANIAGSTHVICQKCGNDAGTYAELKNDATEAVRAQLERRMNDALKRR